MNVMYELSARRAYLDLLDKTFEQNFYERNKTNISTNSSFSFTLFAMLASASYKYVHLKYNKVSCPIVEVLLNLEMILLLSVHLTAFIALEMHESNIINMDKYFTTNDLRSQCNSNESFCLQTVQNNQNKQKIHTELVSRITANITSSYLEIKQ